MNLIERAQQCHDVNHARLQPVGGPPECLMPMALRDKLIAEIERLTAQVEVMREVEKEIILRLQWAHCTTYHKDMEALFREILAAENPPQHLKELTFAFTALSYRGGD